MSEDRGSAMAASVLRTARTFGMPREDLPLLSRAHALAMEPRVAALADDHHPLYLHPGRTVLVLLRDAEVRDVVLLATAAVTESEDARFRIALGGGARRAGRGGGRAARCGSPRPARRRWRRCW